MTTTDHDDGRPRFTAAEAARRCGVSRTSVQRKLAAGQIPGATLTDNGWSIPIEGLISIGWIPDKPSPGEGVRGHARTQRATEQVRAADQLAARVRVLEDELAQARAETAEERVRRLEAEQKQVQSDQARTAAERLAADRAEHVEDLRRTLAMLTAGTGANMPQPPQQSRSRGLLGRIVDAIS